MARSCFFVLTMRLFLFGIFVLSFIDTISPLFTNITTDQSALLSLKAHITHDPQDILATNWSISTSVCKWVGVTCGLRHQRVTVLNVSSFGLTGTIPPHLGNLSFLSELHFRDNRFYSSLPIELARLHRLKLISFAYNDFTGEIPSWFGSFPKLEALYLYGNHFSGSIPTSIFNNCSNLEVINLSTNRLSGSIPKEIGNARKLKTLFIAKNHLTGEIPWEIGNIKLEDLRIFFNTLTGTIPSVIFNMSSLEILNLSENDLSGGMLPDSMCLTLPNLEELRLTNCQLRGPIPAQFPQCRKLRILTLYSNNFTGPFPSYLFNMSNLEIIWLSNNNFEPIILLDNICQNVPKLEWLGMDDCNLGGRISTQLVSQCGKLGALSLENNNFIGSIPQTVGNLTNLEELYLTGNYLTDMIANVADFGISRLLSGSDSITETVTLATIGYMAPEYGLEGVVSTRGDVYSYGVLLMETFTGKKPIDAMFVGELSLKKWVEDAFTHYNVTHVADANCLEGNNLIAVKDCLSSIFELALCCTADSPIERKNMREISSELSKVKLKFIRDI